MIDSQENPVQVDRSFGHFTYSAPAIPVWPMEECEKSIDFSKLAEKLESHQKYLHRTIRRSLEFSDRKYSSFPSVILETNFKLEESTSFELQRD
jgi:hypothetical protein